MKYVYIVLFVLFIPIFFLLLKASNFEKLFKQGRVLEIRISYVLISIILAFLATSAVQLAFSWIE